MLFLCCDCCSIFLSLCYFLDCSSSHLYFLLMLSVTIRWLRWMTGMVFASFVLVEYILFFQFDVVLKASFFHRTWLLRISGLYFYMTFALTWSVCCCKLLGKMSVKLTHVTVSRAYNVWKSLVWLWYQVLEQQQLFFKTYIVAKHGRVSRLFLAEKRLTDCSNVLESIKTNFLICSWNIILFCSLSESTVWNWHLIILPFVFPSYTRLISKL